jgi:hypothetical protein
MRGRMQHGYLSGLCPLVFRLTLMGAEALPAVSLGRRQEPIDGAESGYRSSEKAFPISRRS